ncbi:phosphocholine cytidylyltransferase family protein [Marinoscillum pacificum]|uniref:phosphocholine cytidylyltransferase family protein n=1 Tax=Marinoscillum pacificum TaxID=392723 RepID=UPI0021576158|nr:NTP transferase domain-containing protein [Marinoscillum pacificum]
MNNQCVILAAGKNSRLDTGKPKSLLEINGISLLERHIMLFKQNGCKEFCVVTGHNPDPIREKLVELRGKHHVLIDAVHNERYDLENGFSVSVTEDWIKSQKSEGFFLTMGDHVFDQGFIPAFQQAIENRKVNKHLCLAVDVPSEQNSHIDIEDVTRVLVDDAGHIQSIGKMIEVYNRYDTGLFFLKPQVFQTLKLCFDQKKYTISNMVSQLINDQEATTVDVVGSVWNDVDNPEDLKNSLNLNI